MSAFQRKSDELRWNGYHLLAMQIESSGACSVAVRVNGFKVVTNILLSALPSALELETLLVRFDVQLEPDGCRDIVCALRLMYEGPRLVLRVSDNITYQGRNGSLKRFESDYSLLRVDNFVYIYNPWYENAVI
jgi:hypothetical protein